MFLLQVKNIFASQTQICSLASVEAMLTGFQCCSLMFPSNSTLAYIMRMCDTLFPEHCFLVYDDDDNNDKLYLCVKAT